MSFNRIAIYGHRGWASSAITDALIASGTPVKILHRPDSDVSMLPKGTPAIEVDVDDEESLIAALQDVDIVISLVGQPAVKKQHAFVKAIPKTKVRLFVPSDLGYRLDEQGLTLPILKAKRDVEIAAKDAGIPTTVVLPGNFVESSLAAPLLGVDYPGNRIMYTGNSQHEKLNLCSRRYIAAAYASIFAQSPVEKLQNRAIALSELIATGDEVAKALERKHGSAPQVFHQSLEQADEEIRVGTQKGDPVGMVFYYRKLWGNGTQMALVGDDIWDVKGYKKMTLDELLVEEKMESYKTLPPIFTQILNSLYN